MRQARRLGVALAVVLGMWSGMVHGQQAALQGQVTGIDGAPVAGKELQLYLLPRPSTKEKPPEPKKVETDDKGAYALKGIPPGSYRVSAHAVTDFLGARVSATYNADVELKAGEEWRLDIPLKTNEPILVVTVRDGDGAPFADLDVDLHESQVMAHGRGPTVAYHGKTNASGQFAVLGGFLGGGSGCKVTLFPQPDVPKDQVAGNVTVARGEIKRIEFVLKEGATIAGSVKDGQGKPLANATVSALAPNDSFWHSQRRTATTRPDGRFIIPGLGSKDYTLVVQGPPDANVVWGPQKVSVERGKVTPCDVALTQPGARIAGTLKDSSGKPVPKALVVAESNLLPEESEMVLSRPYHERETEKPLSLGNARTVTDDQGRFALSHLLPAKYSIYLRRPADANICFARVPAFDVQAGQELARDIAAVVGAEILVRVTDQVGQPVKDVSLRYGVAGDSPGKVMEWAGRTAEDGSFVILGLKPQKYEIWAEPLMRDFRQARLDSVQAEAGKTVAVPIVLQPRGPSSAIEGVVTGPDGGPVAGVNIQGWGLYGDNVASGLNPVTTAADGRYRIPVSEAGLHRLEVRPPEDSLLVATWLENIRVEPPKRTTVNIALELSGAVAVSVKDKEGKPLANFPVDWQTVTDDWRFRDRFGMRTGPRTSPDGLCTLKGVRPGRSRIRVLSPIDSGYWWAVKPDVQVRPGETTPVEFALEKVGTGVLSGQVTTTDGKPLQQAFISPMPKVEESSGRGIPTDKNGRCRVELTAGPYEVRVHKEGFRRRTASVVIEAGKTTSLDWALAEVGKDSATIQGRITDADGRPVAGVYLQCPDPDDPWGARATSDAAGNYELRNVLPGKREVAIRPPRAGLYLPQAHEVTVGAGQALMKDFKLEEGIWVEGKVTDNTGKPVPSAWLKCLDWPECLGATDSTGAYRLLLPVGTWQVRAKAKHLGEAELVKTVAVQKGQVTQVDFRFGVDEAR